MMLTVEKLVGVSIYRPVEKIRQGDKLWGKFIDFALGKSISVCGNKFSDKHFPMAMQVNGQYRNSIQKFAL